MSETLQASQASKLPSGPKRILVAAILAGAALVATLSIFLVVGTERHWREACAEQLSTLHDALQLYAYDHEHGLYPPLSPEAGRLSWSADSMSGYFDEQVSYSCPRDSTAPDARNPHDSSYFYLAYIVASDADMEILADAYHRAAAAGVPLQMKTIDAPEGRFVYGDQTKLHALVWGSELFHALVVPELRATINYGSPASEIPVLIERPGHHKGGGHVLFLDGHIEWLTMGKWPMTENTIALLMEMDALGN